MQKPVMSKMPTNSDIEAMELKGYVFNTYDGKKIVGQATKKGYTIFFLEDGSEIVKDQNGNSTRWPEMENV